MIQFILYVDFFAGPNTRGEDCYEIYEIIS